MRQVLLVLALWACVGAPQAVAQTLMLERGRAATLQFDESGGAILVETAAAQPLTPFERGAAAGLVGGHYDYAVGDQVVRVDGDKHPSPEPVPPYNVRIKFVQIPGTDHSLLVIENGYDQGLRYSAVMHIDGAGEATDVCLVMPNLRSLEHWPYRIDSIELSNFRLQPWREGDPIPCA